MHPNQPSRLMASQLPEIVGLTLDEIGLLLEFGLFPPAQGCAGWDEALIHAWVQDLRSSSELAGNVEFVLGYRRDWWASPVA